MDADRRGDDRDSDTTELQTLRCVPSYTLLTNPTLTELVCVQEYRCVT